MAEREELICPEENCKRKFTRRYNLNRHYATYHLHQNTIEKCQLCGQIFQTFEQLQMHYKHSHRPSRKFFVKESAFNKTFVTYRYNFLDNMVNFGHAQSSVKNLIENQILIETAKKTVCKVSLVFVCQMIMLDHANEKLQTASIPFRAPVFLANGQMKQNIAKNIVKSFAHQTESLETFINSGSNWQFERALIFDIEIGAIKPIVAGSNDEKINVVTFKNKKFLFNPPNKDQKCFLYCIAQFLFGDKCPVTKNPKLEERKLRKYVRKFNIKKIQFPISIQDIKRFLKQNEKFDLKINILFRNTKGLIFPLEYGLGNGQKIVNLLMVQKQLSNSGVNHFLLITNPNKYLRTVYSNEENRKSYERKNFCLNCLNSFSSQIVLQDHKRICCMNKPRLEVAPEKGVNDKIFFKNFERQHPLEYVAFLDFEAALPKKELVCKICNTLKCKCDASFTDTISEQKPIGYSFIVLGPENKIIHEKSYMGENGGINFVEHILNEEHRWVKQLLQYSEDMIITQSEQIQFNASTSCYICEKHFTSSIVKCRDHSHITSRYLGAACQDCNLRRRKPNSMKIFVHNGSR